MRIRRVWRVGMFAIGSLVSWGALAQPASTEPAQSVSKGAGLAYPNKPIRIIVQFAPGGQGDVIARTVATKASEHFRQTVLVDNRTGGGGTIAADALVRSNSDGYTFIVASSSYAANSALYTRAFDPVNDITPVALIGDSGLIVTVNPALPVNSVSDLIAHAKANPGKLNYGSSGVGGTPHLATELFNQMTGTRMAHVPYKGNVLALNDLISGQLQVLFGSMSNTVPQIRAGRLRGVAVTSAKRMTSAPEYPAVSETVPGYEAVVWYGMAGPKGVPQAIVTQWNNEVNRILQLPDVKERMVGIGMELAGGPPQRFHDMLVADIARWQRVVKMGNIKVSE
jgi:tripartite-type tricarboxylate transporter receptor subunit TctC